MSPANIEARLKTSSPLIGQACCVGDRRPYNVALIVLDPDTTPGWAEENGIDDASPAALAGEPALTAEIERAVEEANEHLSRVEQIKRFVVLPADWLPGGDELTPTMKLKRKPIGGQVREPRSRRSTPEAPGRPPLRQAGTPSAIRRRRCSAVRTTSASSSGARRLDQVLDDRDHRVDEQAGDHPPGPSADHSLR